MAIIHDQKLAERFLWNRFLGVNILLFFLALLGIYVGAGALLRFFQTDPWPSVPGTILSSEVVSSPVAGHRGRFVPEVRYEFEVGGKRYGSQLIDSSWQPRPQSKEKASEIVDAYTKGQSVSVHYDPEDPGNCRLVPESRSGRLLFALVTLTISVAMAVGAFYWLRVHLRRRKRILSEIRAN